MRVEQDWDTNLSCLGSFSESLIKICHHDCFLRLLLFPWMWALFCVYRCLSLYLPSRFGHQRCKNTVWGKGSGRELNSKAILKQREELWSWVEQPILLPDELGEAAAVEARKSLEWEAVMPPLAATPQGRLQRWGGFLFESEKWEFFSQGTFQQVDPPLNCL